MMPPRPTRRIGHAPLAKALLCCLSLGSPALAQNIDLDVQNSRQDPQINLPELITGGMLDPNMSSGTQDIPINVPELSAGGTPPSKDITVNVSDLVIMGAPDPIDIVIDVPDLVIIGVPDSIKMTINVPALTIVGRFDEPDDETRNDTGTQSTDATTPTPQGTGNADTTLPPLAKAPEAILCYGDYTAYFGQGIGTAVGFQMPFGQFQSAPAQIDVVNCGGALSATIQGQAIALTLSRDRALYSGSINLGDGAQRTLVLSCDEDQNLRGQLVAADANLSIERPVWMIRDAAPAVALRSCDLP